MSIFTIINQIRKRPGMYIRSKNISDLPNFLLGYEAAERELGVSRSGDLFPLDFWYMHEFVKVRLGYDDNLGWWKHILDFCNGDEEAALNKFFELYDEFNEVRMKRYWNATLTKANIQWNDCMEHGCSMRGNVKAPMFINPIAVYVIELTIPAYILVVETVDNVWVEQRFFKSAEAAKGNGRVPFGAESYFGEICAWTEVEGENIHFDKNIEKM